MSNPECLRQKLQVKVSKAAQVAEGTNCDTIDRMKESLADGICPYEDVAFFLAPMLKATINVVAGSTQLNALTVQRFEAPLNAGELITVLARTCCLPHVRPCL